MISEIEVFPRKSLSFLTAIGMTILTFFYLNKLREEIFNWRQFNTLLILKIFTLVFLVITILAWVRFFANNPEFRITSKGIWYRKHFYSRKITEFASWNSIEYYFVEAVTQRGITTEELIIKVRERKKYLKLKLTGINISKNEIIQIMREKANEHNFHDLGIEASSYSKH